MTKREALIALRDAVRDGFNRPTNWRDFAELDNPSSVAGQESRAVLAHRAFHGSLDAAKALHDALLPGWACALNTNGMAQVIGPAPDWARYTGCDTDRPARAWLLAILEALIAEVSK